MSSTATFGESTPSAGSTVEDHFPWDIEAAPSVVENDTWLLSFIDILTLLLALFVLLLAQEYRNNKTSDITQPREPVHIAISTEALPVTPLPRRFSAIQLPPLPQLASSFQLGPEPVAAKVLDSGTGSSPAQALRRDDGKERHREHTGNTRQEQAKKPASEQKTVAPAHPTPTAHSRVNDLLQTLRHSELANRIDIETRTDSVRLDIADSILFAPARTRLTDSGLALLKDLAKTLKTLPWSLSVEGHTDNIPIKTARFPSNWELSTARATMVARELIRHGVRPDRIRAIGYADTHPRADNATPEGRNRNRRVTFVLELPESQFSPEKPGHHSEPVGWR